MTHAYAFTHLWSVYYDHIMTQEGGLIARKLLIWFLAKNLLQLSECTVLQPADSCMLADSQSLKVFLLPIL